jgi:hypothetical protein
MHSFWKLCGVGLLAVGISMTSTHTVLAVLAVGAESPEFGPDFPSGRDPNSPFIPIFRYATDSGGSANGIPEPSSLLLAACAALGLQALTARRRRP